MRERVAEEPADPHDHVDARPAELRWRDDLEAGDPAAGLVPDRPDAEQRQHLGDVVAGGAHGGRAPHRKPDRGRPLPGVLAVAGQQAVGELLAGVPGQPGRDGLGVHGVEIAAGRQRVDQPAQRGSARPGRDVAAVERVQHRVDLAGGGGQPRDQVVGREAQQPLDGLVAAAEDLAGDLRGRAACQPASSIPSTSARAVLGPVDHGAGRGAVLGQAERLAQPGSGPPRGRPAPPARSGGPAASRAPGRPAPRPRAPRRARAGRRGSGRP